VLVWEREIERERQRGCKDLRVICDTLWGGYD